MILSFSSRKSLFLNSYNYFQYNSGLGNTPYGKRDVPNRTCVGASLIPWIKAYIHPHLTVLPAYRSKARIVVFASRKAIPEFSSLCSPKLEELPSGARALRNAGLRQRLESVGT